jgi:cell division transport system permease protein
MTIRTTTWKYIRRSPYQAVAAIITMFVTFLLGGFFFLTSTASAVTLGFFESKPQITVFFSDQAAQKDADALTEKLRATGKTASITYVSKDQALNIYKEQNKDDPLLLEMVTADILPASLEISATDPNFLKDFEPLLKDDPNVEDVVYQEDVVDSMIVWTRAIRTTGLLLAGLLAFDSLLVIVTVIGMKIALRRDEVEVLKLVGASPWYIRMPFIFEGAIYGASGAFFAWIVLTGLMLWFRPVILSVLGLIPVISTVLRDPTQSVFLLSSAGFLGVLVVSGLILGSLGSLLSVGRYLRFR